MVKMLTQKEVADILGVSVHSVTELINANKLVCYRINQRTFRIPSSSVQAFLDGCKSTQDIELSKELLSEKAGS